MPRRTFIVALAVIALATGSRAQTKRFITEQDLFKFTWIADPQISPDGATIVYVNVTVNDKKDGYESALFVVPASGSTPPRRLTSGIRDTSPRWSPDGQRLAFVRAVDKDGKTQPAQVYLLDMNGGEARALTTVTRGAGDPVWSPDGRTIAFTSSTGPEEKKDDGAHHSDVKVMTRAVYRANGNFSYVDADHHSHIFTTPTNAPTSTPTSAPTSAPTSTPTSTPTTTATTASTTTSTTAATTTSTTAAAAGPSPRQITDGEFDERSPMWAPDGSKIYFLSTRVAEPYFTDAGAELFSVPAAGGAIEKVAGIDGSIFDASVSPDGSRVAFVGALRGTPVRSYSQTDLWITNAAPGGTPKNLTASYDFDISGGIGGDQAAPRGQNRKPILWSGDSLVVVSAEKGSANLKRVSIATGAVAPITDGAQDVVAYSATRDLSKLAATISTQTNIGDIAVIDGKQKTEAAGIPLITHVNRELFKDIQQSEPEEMWYRSFDGKQVQSWILKPPDFDASKKYPLILEIHGGPHSAYGNTYTHEFMWMAAKGYVVLFTNPRGSTTYGQEFGNLIQHRYPGDDYKDLMAGVDEILKKGYVDANRLGVTGGSGGGLLTNWTITQTQRFKAAVSQRDIADWYGFWFTADFTLFQPTWFRKAPWEDPQDFTARSPITHVANVTTPLMLILGDMDYRTPPANGGEMMFRALKYRRIPTVMVRFPRETHELSRSGEPWHRIERLQHIVGWMDQWLQGKKNAAYTTQ